MTYYKIVRNVDGRLYSRFITSPKYCVEYFEDRFVASPVKGSGLLVYTQPVHCFYEYEELWEVEIIGKIDLPEHRQSTDAINNGQRIDPTIGNLDWPAGTVMVEQVKLIKPLFFKWGRWGYEQQA